MRMMLHSVWHVYRMLLLTVLHILVGPRKRRRNSTEYPKGKKGKSMKKKAMFSQKKELLDILTPFHKGCDTACQQCQGKNGEPEEWIGCDKCWRWYHCECINNYNFDAPFYCSLCASM